MSARQANIDKHGQVTHCSSTTIEVNYGRLLSELEREKKQLLASIILMFENGSQTKEDLAVVSLENSEEKQRIRRRREGRTGNRQTKQVVVVVPLVFFDAAKKKVRSFKTYSSKSLLAELRLPEITKLAH